MSNIKGVNTGVVALGFLLAFLLTEFAIYLMFPYVNELLAYFMALSVPFMLLMTSVGVTDSMPQSQFLSSEKKGFYDMVREMSVFMGASLILAIIILPLSLLFIYALDYIG